MVGGGPASTVCSSTQFGMALTTKAKDEGTAGKPQPLGAALTDAGKKSTKGKEDGMAEKPQPLSAALTDAGKKALGGGLAGSLAMVVQVLALMWMRTTINFQHKYGMSTRKAMAELYAQGGVARFYQGLGAALVQAPLSRFGDTAADAGMQALLANAPLRPFLKTFLASVAAAIVRIGLMPLDALKTTLQTDGGKGMSILAAKISKGGVSTLYSGALASAFATLVGHYPWFMTHNFLKAKVPEAQGPVARQCRTAAIGFCCSLISVRLRPCPPSHATPRTQHQPPPLAR